MPSSTHSHYAAHGAHQLKWLGEVLYIQFFGVSNLQEVEIFFDDMQHAVAQRGLARWGRIADLRHWEGITPEAKIAYAAISDWYPGAGAIAHVQMYPSHFMQSMADSINQSLARVGPVRQCSSLEDGLAWLQSHGLAIEDFEPTPAPSAATKPVSSPARSR